MVQDTAAGVLTGGITRREALRRAMVVGGSLAVAAPTVQAVTAASAHAQVSPPPGPLHAISFVAFTFVCDGVYYKAKWEPVGWVRLSMNDNGLANCDPIDHWSPATPVSGPAPWNNVPNKGRIAVTSTPHPDDPSEIGTATITLPAGCTFNDGSAAVKGGPGGCGYPLVSGQSITFYGNPK